MTGKNILRGEFMKKIMCFLALCASVAFSAPGAYAGGVSDCMCKGQTLYGKVKVVRNFADFKVKHVSNFPDLKVKRVKNFPDRCGEWQFVDNFPDFTVQFVDNFPDFTIQYVNSFPGER